jgi:hypothetical protein
LRLVNLMTFVCVLLVVAMIPAFVQFAHVTGLPRAASLATAAGLCVAAAFSGRRA